MADRPDSVERIVKVAGIAVTVLTFAFGVWQFNANERAKERIEVKQNYDARRKPYLDRQLALYTDAGKAAATIAAVESGAARDSAEQRFWQLYWGELAMVEDKRVEAAMVQFGRALSDGAPPEVLQTCSLRLSHILRRSLHETWGEKLWESHYGKEPECSVPEAEPVE